MNSKVCKTLKVFILIPHSQLPHSQQPLKGKLMCKCKCNSVGNVVHYKVQYVAKGFTQRYGINYDKTMAPTVSLGLLCTILHIAVSLDWDLRQFNIKTAFLHNVLPKDETMFMEQPPGFAALGKEEWVMQLMKSIYRMKQASSIWNQTFHKAISQWGFECINCEWCVYRCNSPTGTTIFAIHLDNIIATGSNTKETDQFCDLLKSQWDITKLREHKLALGVTSTTDIA